MTLTVGNCEVSIQQEGSDLESFTRKVRQIVNQFTQMPQFFEEDDMVKTRINEEIEYDRLCDK
ncbi:hypothetical protein [Olivibacter sitiensis]|uniref:hypothetical protein n=1 Tax=Olivibacter sitiensis TaxID=376470 RepID=UPI00146F9CA9|nr:hypothetical protein [Olivibacter sitiensis]